MSGRFLTAGYDLNGNAVGVNFAIEQHHAYLVHMRQAATLAIYHNPTELLADAGPFQDAIINTRLSLTAVIPVMRRRVLIGRWSMRRIDVDGIAEIQAMTDENGFFILEDTPAPEFFVTINASNSPAPSGACYGKVRKPMQSVAGHSTALATDGKAFDIFLPLMYESDITPIVADQITAAKFDPEALNTLTQIRPDIALSMWEKLQMVIPPNAIFFADLDNFVIRGFTNASGELSALVPVNTPFFLIIFEPTQARIAIAVGVTSGAGQLTLIPLLTFDLTDNMVDADLDGLADEAERVIGTDPSNPDTDGDGLTDTAEIEQGLDPLDDRGFPTGIIGQLPLQGEPQEIVITGSAQSPENQTAYIATGTHGLAIVDVSQFSQPILLGQLDLYSRRLNFRC